MQILKLRGPNDGSADALLRKHPSYRDLRHADILLLGNFFNALDDCLRRL